MSEWQPIDTAPKDGSLILVFTQGGGPKVVRWYSANKAFGTNEFRVGTVLDATHWMPLPEPPKALSAQPSP